MTEHRRDIHDTPDTAPRTLAQTVAHVLARARRQRGDAIVIYATRPLPGGPVILKSIFEGDIADDVFEERYMSMPISVTITDTAPPHGTDIKAYDRDLRAHSKFRL